MPSSFDAFEFVFSGRTPAVIQTYRKDGTAKLSPVWFRHHRGHFEIVIAEDDIKLKHLTRNPRSTLLIFETSPPFRGVQVTTDVIWSRDSLDETRRAISSRYLDDEASKAFTERRRGNGVVVRIPSQEARTWGLSAIPDVD